MKSNRIRYEGDNTHTSNTCNCMKEPLTRERRWTEGKVTDYSPEAS